jgi:hypothetical protein
MWGHKKNSQTEMWTSDDGLRFEYQGVSIAAKNIGTRNATYTRVYEYGLRVTASRKRVIYHEVRGQRRVVWRSN